MTKQTCTMKIAVQCVEKVTTKSMKIGSLQFQSYLGDFHTLTLLCKTVAETLHHHNVCVRWVPKMLRGKLKGQ
jgi:hypothetical protein